MSIGTYRRYPHEIELGWTLDGLVTVEYAAGLLGEPYSTVDKRLRVYRMCVYRIGDTRFISREQVNELRRLKAPRGRKRAVA